jgi:hypothetical protein
MVAGMGYIPTVKYDLFISYARVDDEAAPEDEGWVRRFVDDLSRAVRIWLALATDEMLEIFLDAGSLRSNEDLETLKTSARNSALFLAVVSPSYVARHWPNEELKAIADAHDAGCIFAIESLPAAYPKAIRNLNRPEFWVLDQQSHRPHRLSPHDRRWDGRIQDLATDIKTVLRAMRHKDVLDKATTRIEEQREAAGPSRTVLLPMTSDQSFRSWARYWTLFTMK